MQYVLLSPIPLELNVGNVTEIKTENVGYSMMTWMIWRTSSHYDKIGPEDRKRTLDFIRGSKDRIIVDPPFKVILTNSAAYDELYKMWVKYCRVANNDLLRKIQKKSFDNIRELDTFLTKEKLEISTEHTWAVCKRVSYYKIDYSDFSVLCSLWSRFEILSKYDPKITLLIFIAINRSISNISIDNFVIPIENFEQFRILHGHIEKKLKEI